MNLLEQLKASLPWTYKTRTDEIVTVTEIGFLGEWKGNKTCWDSNGNHFDPVKIYAKQGSLDLQELVEGGTFAEGRKKDA